MAMKEIIIGLMVVFFVSFALLAFAVGFLQETNPSSPLLSNGSQYQISQYVDSLNKSLAGFNTIAGTQSSVLSSTQPEPVQYVFLFARQLFDIPISLLKFATTGILDYNHFLRSIAQQTTIGTAIATGISLIIAGLIIVAIIVVIQFIRTGQGER